MRDLTCPEVADSAPGFALDILEPRERALVAAHLVRCPECRRTVTDMAQSAAELLDLGGRVGATPRSELDQPEDPAVGPGRRRLRTAVTMAVAAALLVGSALGPELGLHRIQPPVASGVLLAGDQAVGTVDLFAGATPFIEVRADHLAASGKLGVVVGYTDGTARRLGETEVRGGRTAWAGPEPAGAAGPTSVMLVDSTLHQVASASLRQRQQPGNRPSSAAASAG